MNAIKARSSDLLGGLGRWAVDMTDLVVVNIKDNLAARASRREARSWAKALPETFVADLVSKVAMPAHLWDTKHDVDQRTYDRSDALFREFLAAHLRNESLVRRSALADAMVCYCYRQWSESPDVRARFSATVNAYIQADQDRKDAAYADRLARAAANPHPCTTQGQRAIAEQSALNGVGYRHGSGRLLTRNECVQLGLSGRNASQPAPGRLVDAQGLTG